MPTDTVFPHLPLEVRDQPAPTTRGNEAQTQNDDLSAAALPAIITKNASSQTYYTIRLLVDRDRVLDAFRAYAYFRWLDDCLDQHLDTRAERIAFLEHQQALLTCLCRGENPHIESAEEGILSDLLRGAQGQNSGLHTYIQNMMSVMAFDASRRGRLISHHELRQYSLSLSTAVTEALHAFIGHTDPPPQMRTRYHAVIAAHVTHMLRDTFDDVEMGYFNIPCEFLAAHQLDPCDVKNEWYRVWVHHRVQLAHAYFKAGKVYLAQVKNRRCRLAGYAYTARFEGVLNAIENENYQLRAAYPERKTLKGGLQMLWSMLRMMVGSLEREETLTR